MNVYFTLNIQNLCCRIQKHYLQEIYKIMFLVKLKYTFEISDLKKKYLYLAYIFF